MNQRSTGAPGSADESVGTPGARWAWADIDLEAIEHNVGVLRRAVAPAAVWAVVKADGYGHGAVPAALSAIRAGAEGLCVALVHEGAALRAAGVDAPILVLSQQPPELYDTIVEHRLVPTLYDVDAIAEFANAARRAGASGVPVQVKVDTGMHRVGAAVRDVPGVVAAIVAAAPAVRLAGLFTHLAVADVPQHPANAAQLERFEGVLAELAARGIRPPLVHAANSAAALALPSARYDMVRAGIAIYGIEPGDDIAELCTELRPALSLRARVSWVKRLAAGDGVSYGLRHTFDRATTVATVPLGYADGVPRRLFAAGGEVLLGGVRRRIVGVVTMDQLMIDCGDDDVRIGDEVVLLGRQGAEEIRAEEWAARLGTIGYEIVCGISKRIGRRYTSR